MPASFRWAGNTLACCLVFFAATGFARETQQPLSSVQLAKLDAFSRAFGYFRYFHPSDQAALVDWNSFASYGIQETLKSDKDESAGSLLKRLFAPIVVDLEIYSGPEKPRPSSRKVKSTEILAWQHAGVGQGVESPFRSARTNRTEFLYAAASEYGDVSQRCEIIDQRNQEIRFRFKARTTEKDSKLYGFFRVDLESGGMGLFDNMVQRPIVNSQWQTYELSGTVDGDAKHLMFGFVFFGTGSALVDDVSLQWRDGAEWRTIEIQNPDFELGESRPLGWSCNGRGFEFVVERSDQASGKCSAQIKRMSTSIENVGGFLTLIPEFGEVVDASISDNLRLRMPLALPVSHEYKLGDNAETDLYLKQIAGAEISSEDPRQLCLINTVIIWSVFQHFYPYFDQVDTDWDATLGQALKVAGNVKNRKECTEALRWLVSQSQDGHGILYDPITARGSRSAEARFGWVENQLVITASRSPRMQRGDVVTHIDGMLAADYLAEKELRISGSPQLKRFRSTEQLSMGPSSETLDLNIERGGSMISVALEYNGRAPIQEKGDICRKLVDAGSSQEDIWYVDLTRAMADDIHPVLEEIAQAKGVVFDLRGYPNEDTTFVYQHLTDAQLLSPKWQNPEQVRPDRVDMETMKSTQWGVPPLKPRFRGKVVFLTNSNAISFSETWLQIVAHYKLGEIVGSPTAGANGNMNPVALPGGYTLLWTGLRTINQDDSQHHLRGVEPTVFWEPTIQGIIDGRDEVLDA